MLPFLGETGFCMKGEAKFRLLSSGMFPADKKKAARKLPYYF